MSDDVNNQDAPVKPTSLLGLLDHIVRNPVGRPSDYSPFMCDEVVRLGREGKSLAEMAAHLGVSKQTFANWQEGHPEFMEAVSLAKTYAQAWWENAGRVGMLMPGFNGAVYNKQVGNRFRDDHGDHSKVEHSGPNGGPIPTTIQIVGVEPGKEGS